VVGRMLAADNIRMAPPRGRGRGGGASTRRNAAWPSSGSARACRATLEPHARRPARTEWAAHPYMVWTANTGDPIRTIGGDDLQALSTTTRAV
jgi:hypothetical protein